MTRSWRHFNKVNRRRHQLVSLMFRVGLSPKEARTKRRCERFCTEFFGREGRRSVQDLRRVNAGLIRLGARLADIIETQRKEATQRGNPW